MTSWRVLIADDSDDIRLLIRLALRSNPDLEVVGEAADGAQAVALAEVLQPDLLLVDLSMPVMDGLEAIPLVHTASPSTTIIVVSGFLNAELQQRVLEAGAFGFVEKGGDLTQLVKYIQRAMSATGTS